MNYFVHVPKTGGISVRRALPEDGVKVVTHTSGPFQILERLGDDAGSRFVFAFVRNPWDRIVSAFYYLLAGGTNKLDLAAGRRLRGLSGGDFKRFVGVCEEDRDILVQTHLRPQHEWLCDRGGNLHADFVGRFESLEMDFGRACAAMGLPVRELPHVNRSEHRPYREHYDASTRDAVARIYERDIELFGYRFQRG